MAFQFLQRCSDFFNGFPISSMAFRFSSMAFQFSSTTFLFPRNPRKSIYGGKYTKDHHSSFVFPATCSPSFVIVTRSPSFVIATCSPSFVIATRSPSFVIATMRASHPRSGFAEVGAEYPVHRLHPKTTLGTISAPSPPTAAFVVMSMDSW
jgi:hypothetical protein